MAKNPTQIDWSKFFHNKSKIINVDGIGEFKIKEELSAGDMALIFEENSIAKNPNPIRYAAYMICLMVIDDDNKPVFGSVDDVLQMPSHLVDRVANAIFQALNENGNFGLSLDEKIKDTAKK